MKLYKIKQLFKNAISAIKKNGFGYYGEKMLNIAMCCLVALSVLFGTGDAVFPYSDKSDKLILEQKHETNISDSKIRKKQEVYPLKDNFEKILSKAKLITWKDASNIIKNNEGFYLYDVESKGTCINMKKISQNNLYQAMVHGKYEFKILSSILKDKNHIEKRGGIIEYNNSYYIASYEVDKEYGDISIHFIDSKKDENTIDGQHQNEIYKVLKQKEELIGKISL